LAALLVLACLLIRGPLVPVGLGITDEGWFLTAIDRLLAGERLYVDFYRSYAPGIYWLFVPFFHSGGVDLVTVRWVWLGGLALLSAGTFRLARPFAPAWAAFGAGLLPIIVSPPAHKVFVPLAYLGALWLCRRLVEGPRNTRAILVAGIGFGLLGLVRQESAVFGMLIGLVGLLFVFADSRAAMPRTADRTLPEMFRAGGLLAAGAALVWLPIVLSLAADGAVAEAFDQLVLAGARGNAAMDRPLPSFWAVFSGPDRLASSAFFLPGLASALGLALVVRAHRVDPRPAGTIQLLQWSVMAVLSHVVFGARSDVAHLLQALLAPSLVLAFAAGVPGQIPAGTLRRLARLGTAAAALWLVALAATFSDVPRKYALRQEGVPLPVPGGEVIVSVGRAQLLNSLVTGIQMASEPGEPIFVLPYAPALYHLADRPNATRHDVILPGFASEAIQAEVVAVLEQRRTRLVVRQQRAYDGNPDRALTVFAPTIDAYLVEHYAVQARIGNFNLLLRQ
jgi:hypothetical protein